MKIKSLKSFIICLAAFLETLLASNAYTASKQEGWIGKLRGDEVILPLFGKEGLAWTSVRSGDKFPSKWTTASRDERTQEFENLSPIEVPTHCDVSLGLPTTKLTKKRSRNRGKTLGVAYSGNINTVPFIKVSEADSKMGEIVKLTRNHFTAIQNRTFVPTSLYCATIDNSKKLCAYQFEMQGPKENGCFATQVQLGWVTVQNNQYKVLEKKLLDTDCDYQRISTVSPIGVVIDDHKVQVLIEDEGYEDSTYRILLLKDSQLKQIATKDGGSC